jgi:hypothetical protein
VLSAAVAVLAASTAVAKPRLEIVTADPAMVRGVGFAPRESVRVRLLGPDMEMLRRVRATRGGRFSVRFASPAPDRCTGYSIVAIGAAGSYARLRWPVRPACPPALAG